MEKSGKKKSLLKLSPTLNIFLDSWEWDLLKAPRRLLSFKQETLMHLKNVQRMRFLIFIQPC